MKKKSEKLNFVIGLTLIAILCGVLYFVISSIWKALSDVDVKLSTALIAAGATIIVSVISVTIGKLLEHKSTQRATQAEKKIPTYEKIVQLIFQITFATKLGKEPPNEKELMQIFAEITQELVIWGSDDVMNAYYDFRMGSIEISEELDSMPHSKILFLVEDLLIAIRTDLGHKKVQRGKILGLFINDIEQYL